MVWPMGAALHWRASGAFAGLARAQRVPVVVGSGVEMRTHMAGNMLSSIPCVQRSPVLARLQR